MGPVGAPKDPPPPPSGRSRRGWRPDVSFSFGASTPTGRRHSSIESLGIVKSSRWGDGSCYPPWWLARWRPPPFSWVAKHAGRAPSLRITRSYWRPWATFQSDFTPRLPLMRLLACLGWVGSLHGLFASLSLRVPSASLLSLGKEDGCDACWSSSQPDVG